MAQSQAQSHLIVERTIRITQRIPFDESHYPDMTSVQAIDYELRLPREEKIQNFVEVIELFEPGTIELTERVRMEK